MTANKLLPTVEQYAACVGPGWKHIVVPLIERALTEGKNIAQVKEKFGGLRFYYDPSDESFDAAVAAAEAQAIKTCEECGAPGVLRGGGWIKVLCDEHAKGRRPILSLHTSVPDKNNGEEADRSPRSPPD